MTAGGQTVVRALAKTPMRDVARGRFTGRLDPRLVAEEAELPDALADLVVRVSKRTRLRRSERLDVAHELASHFREGLDAGRTPEELIANFGDLKQAARLIRRGKKRARGLIYKVWALGWQAIGIAFSLMIVLYGIHAVRFHMGEPTISVDYLAKINAPALAVPEEKRAWPMYEKAIASYVEPPEDLRLTELRPGDERWGEVVEYVRANAETLELLREAASRKEMGFITSSAKAETGDLISDAIITAILPQLGGFRESALLLAMDTHVAIHEGESDRAKENVQSMMLVAQHASDPDFLISQLVGYSIMSTGIDTTSRILGEAPEIFSDAQWSSVAHSLVGYEGGGRVSIDFSIERMMFYDMLQRIYSDNGEGEGRLTPEGMQVLASFEETEADERGQQSSSDDMALALAMPVVDVVVAGRAETRREYDRVMDLQQKLADQPPWSREEVEGDDELLFDGSTVWKVARYPLIEILLPALHKAAHAADVVTMRRDATLVSIALELHRREHGTFPDSLDELVPALLPSIPRDMIDGQPIRYARTGDSYTLYSIGADGDNDGGRPALEKDGDWDRSVRNRAETDGDWILFPPEPRKEPKEHPLRP